MYVDDTIVAPATAPGRGAVAIVRLSGRDAHRIANAIWHPLKPVGHANQVRPRRLRLGEIRDPEHGAVIDRAMVVFFDAPRTLTGEPVAELHCHGGTYLMRRVLGVAIAAGARYAEPGEFTRRAFLNGRIDLTAAEAVRDLVEARGERALNLAIAQLAGALAERVGGMRRQILSILAQLEAAIDFADEDLDLPGPARIAALIDTLIGDVAALHASFERGRLRREGIRVAIVGRPNVGKSSLLNLMLGAERAIVTPIPGTTRDVIEETIELVGYAVMLQDTAGIRGSGDAVELIGIERALEKARDADLLIAVFDAASQLASDDFQVIELARNKPSVTLLNKCDLPAVVHRDELQARGLCTPMIDFSATRAIGLEELKKALQELIEAAAGAGDGDDVAISRIRHREALGLALEALGRARESALVAMPPEIVAVEINAAAEALTAITGVVGVEDVLDVVFREFCIGK